MLQGKQLLSLAVLVLAFIVSCAAMPALEERNSMQCTQYSNPKIKVCRDSGKTKIYGMAMDKVNNMFYSGLPSDKKYTNFEFCISGACGSMSTITGTQFIPKNYQSVARRARQHWLDSVNCIGDGSLGLDYFYSTAVDIYMPDDNFVFSWWIKSLPTITGKC